MEMAPETSRGDEERGEAMNKIRKGILDIEGKIDDLHTRHLADSGGVLFRESAELTPDWLDFIENCEEVLTLNPEETRHIRTLIPELLRGELNDAGKEEDLKKVIQLKLRFEEAKQNKEG